MDWLNAVAELRANRSAGTLVTVVRVRGHAPRDPGAKMVVAPYSSWGTVGGGNIEAMAIEHARNMGLETELMTVPLTDKAPYRHGVQCCGGEVTLLFEPLPVPPSVLLFGFGHVGYELARILSRLDLDLHVVDSRVDQFSADRTEMFRNAPARVVTRHIPVMPEQALADVSASVHVLIMTHDHAEDLALCDAALRNRTVQSIGLIGSSAKWSNFRRKLTEMGHSPSDVARIRCPIGIPGVRGKAPAVVGTSVAAELLQVMASPTTVNRNDDATEP